MYLTHTFFLFIRDHPDVTKRFLDNIHSLFKFYNIFDDWFIRIQALTEKHSNTIRLTFSPEELRKRRQQIDSLNNINYNDTNVSMTSTAIDVKGKSDQIPSDPHQPYLNGIALDLDDDNQIEHQNPFSQQNLKGNDAESQITSEDEDEKEILEKLHVSHLSNTINQSLKSRKPVVDSNVELLKSLRNISEEKKQSVSPRLKNFAVEDPQLPSTKYKVHNLKHCHIHTVSQTKSSAQSYSIIELENFFVLFHFISLF